MSYEHLAILVFVIRASKRLLKEERELGIITWIKWDSNPKLGETLGATAAALAAQPAEKSRLSFLVK